MRCKEGEALDFIQDGHIEFEGELPLNPSGGSLGTGRIHGSGTSSKAHSPAAPDRAGSRTPTGPSWSPAPRRDRHDVHLLTRSLLRQASSRRRFDAPSSGERVNEAVSDVGS